MFLRLLFDILETHDKPLYIATVIVFVFFVIYIFAVVYTNTGIVDSSGNTVDDFSTCTYFSIVTFTTLGYGDFQPTEVARPVAAIEALFGYIFMGILIGTTVFVLTNKYAASVIQSSTESEPSSTEETEDSSKNETVVESQDSEE